VTSAAPKPPVTGALRMRIPTRIASAMPTNRELGVCGFAISELLSLMLRFSRAARAPPGGASNACELEAKAKADLDLPVASRFLLCRAAA
jgi:hypothetical protein